MSPSHHMANFGPVTSADRFRSLEHPSKFQRVSRLAFVTAPMSLNGSQPNFARCFAVSWACTLYVHFSDDLAPDGILSGAKFTLRPSLAYNEWNYGTFGDGATYIRQGGHHVGNRPTF